MVKRALKKITDLLVVQGHSVEYVTFSVCLGVFIACSPFIGLHTAMVFALSWLLGAHVAIVFAVTYLVSNPVTMVPLLAVEYIFGRWLFNSVFGMDLVRHNPSWMAWFNGKVGHYLSEYLGIPELCFWCFIVGGTIFAVLIAIMAYPCTCQLVVYIVDKKKKNENNSAE